MPADRGGRHQHKKCILRQKRLFDHLCQQNCGNSFSDVQQIHPDGGLAANHPPDIRGANIAGAMAANIRHAIHPCDKQAERYAAKQIGTH